MAIYGNIIQGVDESFSVYNATYQQSYRSKSLGAYTETLLKHIYPALFFRQYGSFCNKNIKELFLKQVDSIQKHYKINADLTPLQHSIKTLTESMPTQKLMRPLRILDICFGLGYNAMLSLQYFQTCEITPQKKIISCKNFIIFHIIISHKAKQSYMHFIHIHSIKMTRKHFIIYMVMLLLIFQALAQAFLILCFKMLLVKPTIKNYGIQDIFKHSIILQKLPALSQLMQRHDLCLKQHNKRDFLY